MGSVDFPKHALSASEPPVQPSPADSVEDLEQAEDDPDLFSRTGSVHSECAL